MGCVHDLSDLLNQRAKETSSTAATYQSIYGCYHSYRRFSSRLSDLKKLAEQTQMHFK